MDSRSTRSILVRLGLALCLLGAAGGALNAAAMAASGRALHDAALLLAGVAVVAGLLLLALGMMLGARSHRPELYHGPESSTLSFAPPSIGTFPVHRRLPNLRRMK